VSKIIVVQQAPVLGVRISFRDDARLGVQVTLAALAGLATAQRQLVVILGGDGKGQCFEPLAGAVAAYARAVVLIGKDGPRIGQELQGLALPVVAADTLPQAVARAAQLAQAGDAVLLSPACASFDMFRNYEHRAEVFVQAVRQLAAAAAAVPAHDAAPTHMPASEPPCA
jgi:UDP-N-acetylmuramoylalanine--D-glutamate ligase